jgi:hypothetical protein
MSSITFTLILFSIFFDSYKVIIPNLDKINISLSVASFSLSLILYGFKFDERANLFRECYLKLQDLYNSNKSEDEESVRYADILGQYPNHSEYDFKGTVANLIKNDNGFDKNRYNFSKFDLLYYNYILKVWKFVAFSGITPVFFCLLAIFLPVIWSK